MNSLLSIILTMSIAGSIVVALWILLRPITVKFFSARWQYATGKIAIGFFLIPIFLLVEKISSLRPVKEIYPAESSIVLKALPSSSFSDAVGTLVEKHLTTGLWRGLFFTWLIGVVVFAGWHFYCYLKFNKQVKIHSFPIPEDIKINTLLSTCKTALNIHGDVKLMLNSKITSPMLVGLYHPIIFLPSSNVLESDLKLVLTHELMHVKQKDLWIKLFALFASTLHWFNPFVHFLRKDIGTWSEFSCDEAVALNMTHEERKHYGQAILNTLANHSSINPAFCSSLCESKKHIKRRLTMLLNVKKMKKHIVVVALVAILAIAGIGTTISVLASGHEKDLNTNEVLNIPSLELSDSGEFILKELEGHQEEAEALTEHTKLSPENETKDIRKFGPGVETLISVKLSDEGKFTEEQWIQILKGIEDGTIMVESE